ncbi:amino acid-binding protein [Sinomonas cellulolyticus]|jgi:glutamate transport system substrate-binding protein|uniref:Glutamate ABC transporter substrate-binding protein n=1 Tax=Sinomonas cellulolyticus TaxID=2801916 RepID=A0ABS1K7T9_9MICC|nr:MULTISPECIES: glutamate ABC transporter substrate-binding protein [Sinomonas]MBL0707377.1 glutamate ABC transporter substrate-binding protein [Sinomonas cellulolyticus]GHG50931.1 amino acid-binding protein [Sinomonas sp. KCTC 49339]
MDRIEIAGLQLSRRKLLGIGLGTLSAGALAACSSSPSLPASSGSASAGAGGSSGSVIDLAAYDAVLSKGAVADASLVDGNEWAKAIKARGSINRGGTDTSSLFSLRDPATGKVAGFDAGMSQLLAKYITGQPKENLSQVTVDTRETLLQNQSVDLVIATYSITPARQQKVDFAGPYYESKSAILVKTTNTTINSVDDLAGKNVATQAASTGVALLQKYAPKANVQTFDDNPKCLAAVQQGRVDAYVIDQSILLSDVAKNKDVKIVGDPFGNADPYGIGLHKGSDALAFVNAWLKVMEGDGSWAALWKATVGQVVKTDPPKPPAIAS